MSSLGRFSSKLLAHLKRRSFRPEELSGLNKLIDARIYKAFADRLLLPPPASLKPESAPFMHYSTCVAEDFLHPRFHMIAKLLGRPPCWHRKLWEWAYITHHLIDRIQPGQRGLGFGVGTEPLTPLFASLGAHVVATDAPNDRGKWSYGNQWANGRDSLRAPHIIADPLFDERVEYLPCDMNIIPADFRDFDFVWSSCSLEHLGSLEAGIRFVENSMRTLKRGGIAVHTTEFNVLSDTDTVDTGDTVIYRKRDMEGLVESLTARGHKVTPFSIGPDSHFLDHYIDVPPFTAYPHLKLRLAEYVTTSAGLMIEAG